MITIRQEAADDATAVREVNERAFGGPAEASLVEQLRDRGAVTLSLASVDDTRIVGHILFSPAEIVSEAAAYAAVALGPMAVLPETQRQGVGSRMVRRGLEVLREGGHRLLIVLGHADYYPRFGFLPASRLGIRCSFDVPDEVFMAREIERGAWRGGNGLARYQPEFETV